MMSAQGYIPDNSIISAKIVDGAITSAKIADGTITPADINSVDTSGGFTGNATAGRAIPHNLGKTPTAIYLLPNVTSATDFFWCAGMGSNWKGDDGNLYNMGAAPDATNFYVGVAVTFEGNANLTSYKWVAIL